MILFLLFLIVPPAHAGQYSFDGMVDAEILEAELAGAGFGPVTVVCDRFDIITSTGAATKKDTCIITSPARKSDVASIVQQHQERARNMRKRARGLLKKLLNKTISAEEKDELLKLAIFMLGI